MVTPVLVLSWMLGGCADTLSGPLDLFHDLEGGEIAAQRPPPPGAGMPYPSLGTVPAKPVLPNSAYRSGLQAQLLAERDRTERVAADTPIPDVPPLPPVAPPPAVPAPAAPASAAAPAPGIPQTGAPAQASATLDTAESVPAPAAPLPAAVAADGGPAPGTTLTIAGAMPDLSDAPSMPAAPPPPATFEGVAPEPSPSPHVLPAGLAAAPTGTQVYFAAGATVLPPSQQQALKDFVSHRGHHQVEIIGLGEAASDTPDGQAAAVSIALRRAMAVQAALQALHVPQGAMRVSANAFGRGAVLRLLP